MMPGIMPAMNSEPTDAPVLRPHKMNGMLGGMIIPSPAADATSDAANVLSYPSDTSSGIAIAPTAAQVAGPEPEIAP